MCGERAIVVDVGYMLRKRIFVSMVYLLRMECNAHLVTGGFPLTPGGSVRRMLAPLLTSGLSTTAVPTATTLPPPRMAFARASLSKFL